MKISVCMATYNGAHFVDEQITSIIKQLGQNDEVIVVDDRSTDNTVDIIRSHHDPRITVIENTVNQGPITGFMKAMQQSTGDYVFFSDQDDVWFPDKVAKVMDAFEKQQAMVVVHDAVVTDQKLNPIDQSWNKYNHTMPSLSIVKTLAKNGYTGAMMAISREMLPMVLPFPPRLPMHDWWIALVALKHHRKVVILPDKLMDYRRHTGNVTGKRRKAGAIISDRLTMLRLLLRH